MLISLALNLIATPAVSYLTGTMIAVLNLLSQAPNSIILVKTFQFFFKTYRTVRTTSFATMESTASALWYNRRMTGNDDKTDKQEARNDKKLSLVPLSFEEALTGLLQVAPPPNDAAPGTEPEAPPQKRPRKRKAKQEERAGQ